MGMVPNLLYTGFLIFGSITSQITFYPKEDNFQEHFSDQYIGGQVQYKITGKLKLSRGQLINPLFINVKCSKYPEQNGKKDLDGQFSVNIKALRSFYDIVQCTTTITRDADYSFDSTFTKGTYSVYKEVPVCLKDVILNLQGKFIDPINQPKSNLQLTLSLIFQEDSKYILNIPSLTTDTHGIWELKDQIIKAIGKYKNGINHLYSLQNLQMIMNFQILSIKILNNFISIERLVIAITWHFFNCINM